MNELPAKLKNRKSLKGVFTLIELLVVIAIISDLAETGAGLTSISSIPNNTAHFYNGSLSSINVGYADGHVETQNPFAISWQYTAEASYFY